MTTKKASIATQTHQIWFNQVWKMIYSYFASKSEHRRAVLDNKSFHFIMLTVTYFEMEV